MIGRTKDVANFMPKRVTVLLVYETTAPLAATKRMLPSKIEKLIIDGKVTLVDDEGKPLEKVASSCGFDSEDETKSYENDDYGYDPYDDDMYERQDIPDNLQAICDKLEITVRGRRKK
ncbi:hypothetical protein Tco_1456486 [Tanacetum coccineum]